jgi:hypothetical protein
MAKNLGISVNFCTTMVTSDYSSFAGVWLLKIFLLMLGALVLMLVALTLLYYQKLLPVLF